MAQEMKSYYAVIPATVRYDRNLPDGAKLLYGEITALCNQQGFCWAGNQYFADLYGKSKNTIGRWITALSESGYIIRNIRYKEGTREIDARCITVCDNPVKNSFDLPLNLEPPSHQWGEVPPKIEVPSPQKSCDPPLKNGGENTTTNTTLNNTKNNPPKIPQEVQESSLSDSVKSTLCEWLRYKDEKRQSYKPTGLQKLISQIAKKCKEFGDQPVIDCISLSMANNWQGIIWDRIDRNGGDANVPNSNRGNNGRVHPSQSDRPVSTGEDRPRYGHVAGTGFSGEMPPDE